MIARPMLFLSMLILAGCQSKDASRTTSDSVESVYQLIISDLAQKDSPDSRFVGTEVWVAPEFCEGDSLIYSWGDFEVDEDLVAALKEASRKTGNFPSAEQFGPNTRVTKIESFHDLHYYGEGSKHVAAKCIVQFRRPGHTKSGERAVVRFYYGPSPHGTVGTYVLRRTNGGWSIVASTISYYA